MREIFRTIQGIKVRFLVRGEGEPIILLHGLGGSVASWRANIGPLSNLFKVYAIDLPGHGASEKPDIDYNLPFALGFLQAFYEEEKLSAAWLMGVSTGGLIAFEYAYDFPGRVQGLILVDSVGFGRELAPFLRFMSLPLLGEVMSEPSRSSTWSLLKTLFYEPSAIPREIVEEVYNYRKSPGAKKAVLKALRTGVTFSGLRREFLVLDKAKALNIPTLIVWGAKDRITPVTQAYKAHQAIKNSELQVFPLCGHWTQMEKADEFNDKVLSFAQAASQQRAASADPEI